MKQAVGYPRVSSDEQRNEGHSLDYQQSQIIRTAEKAPYRLLKMFACSESAKKAGRTVFNEMLSYINQQAGTITLLVASPDRLSRNQFDEAMIQNLVLMGKVVVHYINENKIIDANASPSELMMTELQGLQARYEVRNLSVRIKSGNRGALEKGMYPHRKPYGYVSVNKIAVPHPERSKYVQEAFNLYATGKYSLKSVRLELFNRGIFYLPSEPKCPVSRLEVMLKNNFYYGGHPVASEGTQTPIINRFLFKQVQDAFQHRSKPVGKKHTFAYSRILKCDECGSLLSGEHKKKATKTRVIHYTYYRCTKFKVGCSQGYIREDKIDAAMSRIFQEIEVTPELKENFLNHAKAHCKGLISHAATQKARLNELIKRAEGKRAKALDLLMDDVIEKAEYEQLRLASQLKIDSFRLELEQVIDVDNDLYKKATFYIELPEKLSKGWQLANTEQKQELVNLVTSNLFIKDGNVRAELIEPLKGISLVGQIRSWWTRRDEFLTFFNTHGSTIEQLKGVAS